MDNLKPQKNYWDDVASKKKFHTPFAIDFFLNYVAPQDTVLDFGCGYGRILEELLNHNFNHLHGVDFSEKMLQLAKEKHQNITFTQNADTTIPYEDEMFDALIVCAVLGCITKEEEQHCLIREISRVLKKGGIFYLSDFLLNRDQRNIKRYQAFQCLSSEYPYGVFQLADGALLRHHTEAYIQELLAANFEIEIFKKTKVSTMNNHYSNSFIAIGRKK